MNQAAKISNDEEFNNDLDVILATSALENCKPEEKERKSEDLIEALSRNTAYQLEKLAKSLDDLDTHLLEYMR